MRIFRHRRLMREVDEKIAQAIDARRLVSMMDHRYCLTCMALVPDDRRWYDERETLHDEFHRRSGLMRVHTEKTEWKKTKP